MAKNVLQPNFGPLEVETASTNLALSWSTWYKSFKLYLVAAKLEDETDKCKVALLLTLIGQQGMNIFNSFAVDEDSVKYVDLVKRFETHFTPKKNVTFERHRFLTRRQKDNESIDDYATELKNLSLSCEFGTLRDELVRDLLIVGLNQSSGNLKERLLQETGLTLDKAIEICKTHDLTHSRVIAMQNPHGNPDHQVSAVNRRNNVVRIRGRSENTGSH
ncbi:Hypothetical protein NTJ_01092 [Nesidiocoris tenuis]|nr:Hypothetical protein NTJ_01092 [Nesidiocoris tenuis]